MILSELNYYNSNCKNMISFREDDTRKNKTSVPSKDPIHIDNYENLKLEEITSEIMMHHDFILNDIVPLMNSDQAMFVECAELLIGLTLFGSNSVLSKMPPRFDHSPRDPFKLSLQLENNSYQRLLRDLRAHQEKKP
jgi:hypothetical protein